MYICDVIKTSNAMEHECIKLTGLHHCPECHQRIDEVKMSEIMLQKDCKKIFDMAFPKAMLIHHQNNASDRGQGAKNKSLGVRKGMPDFQVLHNGRTFFIEMKVGKGSLSADQKEMIHTLEGMGFITFTCYSLEHFMSICKDLLKICYFDKFI